MNIKLLAVVTPPSIYHGFSNWKTFWWGNFTLGEFTPVNMKNCDFSSIRKHRDIEDGEKYITLDISLKFDSMYKMEIISLESKEKLERSVKRLINSLGFKSKLRPHKYKNSRYAANKTLSRSYSADKDKLCSTEEDKS